MISRAFPLLLVAGCATVAPVPTDPSTDLDLLTALFADARSIEAQLADDFACAGIIKGGTEEDASPELLERLKDRLGTPVYPASQCRRADDSGIVSAPGATGEGTWLNVRDLACSSPTRCTAKVSYYVANMAAGGREVSAEFRNGAWVITPSGAMWIS